MNLPITDLRDYFVLYDLCTKQCINDESGERLTSEGISLYPSLISHLVVSTQKALDYLIQTENETPYLAGAGMDFVENLNRLFSTAIDLLQLHIPLRYHESTGADHSCVCEKENQARKLLQDKIKESLTIRKMYIQLIMPEDWPTEIEREYVGWINKLYSTLCAVKRNRADFCFDKTLNAFIRRRKNYLAINKEKLDNKIVYKSQRSSDCLKLKIAKHKNAILHDPDPLWQQVVEEAFDSENDKFRFEDIASILYEHKDDLLPNAHFDDIIYQNLYLYEKLTERLQELLNPNLIPFQHEEPVDIVPANLTEYPKLALVLSDWIKADQRIFDLLIEGIITVCHVIKPSRFYYCSWAHLYRAFIKMKVIELRTSEINSNKFAEALFDVLDKCHEKEDMPKSSDTIRHNIGDHLEVFNSPSLGEVDPHKKKIEKLIACFDKRLRQRLSN